MHSTDTFEFEGRRIPIETGDTIASALFRAGVRTFSRSFKYRRKRGLYCLTGDCPNCLMTVDGEPAVRTCCTPAAGARRVDRPAAWPSAEHDAMSVLWHLRALLPVGFYYKSMIRPRGLFPRAEKVIRKLAGLGPVSRELPPAARERLNHHPELLVVGAGVAGLGAALEAAGRGEHVVIADEGEIGKLLAAGEARAHVQGLHDALRQSDTVTILEHATAVGIYEGPLVPIIGEDFLHLVHPERIVVATGAVEQHAVFPGSDLPGIWLGRGAARMAGVHGLPPGRRIVVATSTEEGVSHLETLLALTRKETAVRVVVVVVPAALAGRVAGGPAVYVDGEVIQAQGRGALRGVVIATREGRRETIACDALVVSLGVQPRDGLLRQAVHEPVCGAGEVVRPGCTVAEAEASGRAAARGDSGAMNALRRSEVLPPVAAEGFVCLCEDVGAAELSQAWDEGYRSTELLKRYTTTTMGACQGALCHPHLRAFACARSGGTASGSGSIAPDLPTTAPTTARPPARAVRLEDVAAGARIPLEYHTALHDRHLARGATMEWTGVWKRPERYHADLLVEYWAVRKGVSVMDVSTLGKYRVAGPDATAFLEQLYPCRVRDLKPWRSRYALLLNEAGYVFDDGLICSLGAGGYYLTFTSGGGDGAEAWMREWAEIWGFRVHIANQTASRSAINVAGPRARELVSLLSRDAVDPAAIPYGGLREITVAGVPCLALRVGFVGELSYELHHPSRRSGELWDALVDAGRALDVVPHGLEALRLLRLEKGHIIVGQDTDFDTTPSKVGMDWAVKMDKPAFVGRTALVRLAAIPRERSLLAVAFAGSRAPTDGAQLFADGAHVGYLTSSRFSPVLGRGVALGWTRHPEGRPPATVTARDAFGEYAGVVTSGPFYDVTGERLRG